MADSAESWAPWRKLGSRDKAFRVVDLFFTWLVRFGGLLAAAALLAEFFGEIRWGGIYKWTTQSLLGRIVCVGILLLFGRGLFWIRENLPAWYGLTEIVVGMVAGFLALSPQRSADNFERGLKLITGVYLIVRGFDNRINGLKRLHDRQAASPARAQSADR